MKTKSNSAAPTEAEIRVRAYYLWLERGRPTGQDQEIWFAAKAQLQNRVVPRSSTTLSTHQAPRRSLKGTVAARQNDPYRRNFS